MLSWILTIMIIFWSTEVYRVHFTQGINIFLNVWLYSPYKFTITDITGVACLKKKPNKSSLFNCFYFLKTSVCVLLVILFFELPNLQLDIRKENSWTKIEESLWVFNYYRYSRFLLCLVLSSVPLNGVNLLWPLGPLETPELPEAFIMLAACSGPFGFFQLCKALMCGEKISDNV